MQCTVVSNVFVEVIVPEPTPELIYPYYGVGPILTSYDEALILGLGNRGDAASRVYSFDLTTTNKQLMYYAYPVEYGLGTFVDRDNGMEGGWDGALMHLDQLGPAIVDVTITGRGVVPFYLYRSEWPWTGTSKWRVK